MAAKIWEKDSEAVKVATWSVCLCVVREGIYWRYVQQYTLL